MRCFIDISLDELISKISYQIDFIVDIPYVSLIVLFKLFKFDAGYLQFSE